MIYRKVYNDDTGIYRVQKLGLFGWSFVTEPDGNDYLNFNSSEEAENWICKHTQNNENRRWRIIDTCHPLGKTS